jgi:class 3 adenylate cyclase
MASVEEMQLRDWLADFGVEECAEVLEGADVDLDVLRDLTEEDLLELGLSLGIRKKLAKGIAVLQSLPMPVKSEAPAPRPERRLVTVVFLELVDSTALSSRHDAEDMAMILQTYHGLCGAVAELWGGRLVSQYGDGCMLLFGHPVAHGDDTIQAVRAALQILRDVGTLEPVPGVRLVSRAAIATGRVVIGDLEGRQDPDAVAGETPNLAARLQAIAEPGTVVVAASTRRLLGDRFHLATQGGYALKGFDAPVEAWTVTGEADPPEDA